MRLHVLQPSPQGVVIAVRAMPRAGRSRIAGVRAGSLLVKLAAAPVDGAANDELIDVLASALQVPKRHLSVIGGQRARDKRVLLAGASLADVEKRLADIIPG